MGGHFSVGDNETLAKLVDTITEVTSRRLAEAIAYQFFLKFPEGFSGDRSSGLGYLSQDQQDAVRSLLLEMNSP